MVEKISLKQTERKVFKTVFNDGLWDIFIGSFFLQFAIAPLLSSSLGDFWSSAIFLPFWALLFVFILLTRKHIISPRIGFVKFGPERKRKLTKFTVIMLIINIMAFIVGIIFALNANVISGWIYSVFIGLIILGASSIATHLLDFTRLFFYGLLFMLSLVIGEWSFIYLKTAHHGFPITFGISAGIIIITGLVLFFRLLKNNPMPIKESVPRENGK
jgi:MFS family permease